MPAPQRERARQETGGPSGREARATGPLSADGDIDARIIELEALATADLRVAALAAVGPRLTLIEPALIDVLLARLAPDVAPLDRLAAARALGSLRRRESKGGKWQTGFARLLAIGSRDGLVFEHSDVSDVSAPLVRREREGERQPSQPQ